MMGFVLKKPHQSNHSTLCIHCCEYYCVVQQPGFKLRVENICWRLCTTTQVLKLGVTWLCFIELTSGSGNMVSSSKGSEPWITIHWPHKALGAVFNASVSPQNWCVLATRIKSALMITSRRAENLVHLVLTC